MPVAAGPTRPRRIGSSCRPSRPEARCVLDRWARTARGRRGRRARVVTSVLPDGPLRRHQQRRLEPLRRRLRRRPRLPRARPGPVRRARRGVRLVRRRACCSGRRYLRQVGLFDDRFFLYYEDTDLSWRGRLPAGATATCRRRSSATSTPPAARRVRSSSALRRAQPVRDAPPRNAPWPMVGDAAWVFLRDTFVIFRRDVVLPVARRGHPAPQLASRRLRALPGSSRCFPPRSRHGGGSASHVVREPIGSALGGTAVRVALFNGTGSRSAAASSSPPGSPAGTRRRARRRAPRRRTLRSRGDVGAARRRRHAVPSSAWSRRWVRGRSSTSRVSTTSSSICRSRT